MGSSLSQQSAEETITQWRSKPSHELIFDAGHDEISQYLQAVGRLQQSPNVKGSDDNLILAAMDRLRGEFEAVLSRLADYQAGPISTTEWSVSDSTANAVKYEDYVNSDPPRNDENEITYLRNIAERMNASGKLGECVEIYKSVRKSFLQARLEQLRFAELSGNYNGRKYMPNELKEKMKLWIEVSKICVTKLFDREKRLCDEIFQNLGNGVAKDECFVGTVKDFAVSLFGFAEAMSLSKQPYYEKMEIVLGVYDAFFWVLPSANELFLSEQGKRIRDSIAQILSKIENDVGRMMYDLQNAVDKEISEVLDDRGGVHQLTKHVMEQINVIVSHKDLLTKLIKSAPSSDFGDLRDYSDNHSFLELHLIMIIEVLQKNLGTKSRRYQDPLRQVFMRNNVDYIVQIIEGSDELRKMIGDQYLTNLKDRSAQTSHQKSTCHKFLACLFCN